jgi:hypothetical protein
LLTELRTYRKTSHPFDRSKSHEGSRTRKFKTAPKKGSYPPQN